MMKIGRVVIEREQQIMMEDRNRGSQGSTVAPRTHRFKHEAKHLLAATGSARSGSAVLLSTST